MRRAFGARTPLRLRDRSGAERVTGAESEASTRRNCSSMSSCSVVGFAACSRGSAINRVASASRRLRSSRFARSAGSDSIARSRSYRTMMSCSPRTRRIASGGRSGSRSQEARAPSRSWQRSTTGESACHGAQAARQSVHRLLHNRLCRSPQAPPARTAIHAPRRPLPRHSRRFCPCRRGTARTRFRRPGKTMPR